MVKTRLAWVLGARDACMAFTSYRSRNPEIPKKSNVVIQTSDNNNWIFWVLGSRLVQFLSNSGHLLRRYGENDEDVFLLTKISHADNSAEKDNNWVWIYGEESLAEVVGLPFGFGY
jgi:hypothetical protein